MFAPNTQKNIIPKSFNEEIPFGIPLLNNITNNPPLIVIPL